MSQPCNANCDLAQPGEVDEELGEFWVGAPFKIRQQHNLSAFERNRLFLNVRGEEFLDVSHIGGADSDGDGRASLAVDVNHDGMLDLVVRQAGGGPLLIYENRFPPQKFLRVTLRGRRSNRLGIGSRLVATVGDREMTRECYPANTFMSQAPLAMHFGLADATQVERLVVSWPSGVQQTFLDLPANRHIVITESDDQFEVVEPGQQIAP